MAHSEVTWGGKAGRRGRKGERDRDRQALTDRPRMHQPYTVLLVLGPRWGWGFAGSPFIAEFKT